MVFVVCFFHLFNDSFLAWNIHICNTTSYFNIVIFFANGGFSNYFRLHLFLLILLFYKVPSLCLFDSLIILHTKCWQVVYENENLVCFRYNRYIRTLNLRRQAQHLHIMNVWFYCIVFVIIFFLQNIKFIGKHSIIFYQKLWF